MARVRGEDTWGEECFGPGSICIDTEAPGVEMWLRGEHDIATRDLLAGAIIDVASLPRRGVVVDLSGASFIDASTLGALVQGQALLARQGVELRVRGQRPLMDRVLRVCGLETLLEAGSEPGGA